MRGAVAAPEPAEVGVVQRLRQTRSRPNMAAEPLNPPPGSPSPGRTLGYHRPVCQHATLIVNGCVVGSGDFVP